MAPEITSGALKHGIPADVIRAVLAEPIRLVPQGDRLLYIGLGPDRNLVEVILEKGPAPRVVHAMWLRPKNYPYLSSR
ncbi:MAG: hypothetical protein OJJ54_04740 [Pseudonocardia sp.]|nr:hypothetical protein [Pseudonocardia sp.]